MCIMLRNSVFVAVLFALTACETMHGFGRDLNKLGNNISGAASGTQ